MGGGLVGKGRNGHWAKCESWARWPMGEMKFGRNGKWAGQILGGMQKGQSWKGQKKNGRNGKNSGVMGMGETELGELGINHLYYHGRYF